MRVIVRLAVILAVIAGAIYGSQLYMARTKVAETKATAAEAPPVQVDAMTLKPTKTRWTVPAVGSISPAEQLVITSETSRRIVGIHFTEGQDVNTGEVLFDLDKADLEADLRQLEAERDRVQLREDRLDQLTKAEAVSASEYDDAKLEGKALEAKIERMRVDIDRCRIVAPFAGRVGFRRVSLGAYVQDGNVLTTLTNDHTVKIDFRLPERYSPAAKVGGSFSFRTAEEGAQWEPVKITAVEALIETDTRSLVIRGEVANPERKFIPGAFVEIEVVVREDDNSLMVPTYAIIPGARGANVYLVEQGKAVVRDVQLGERTADAVEVVSGLESGDMVITSNLLRLRPNGKVQVVESPLEDQAPATAAGADGR